MEIMAMVSLIFSVLAISLFAGVVVYFWFKLRITQEQLRASALIAEQANKNLSERCDRADAVLNLVAAQIAACRKSIDALALIYQNDGGKTGAPLPPKFREEAHGDV